MDIRFCSITNESIPDGEFEAGRAITVGGKSYYVSAALQRVMARSRLRAWLTFVLVVYAAGVTTFLLTNELRRTEPDPHAVPSVVSAEIDKRVGDLEAHLMDADTGIVRTQLASLTSSISDSLAAAETHREAIHKAVSSVAEDIDNQEVILNQRFDSMDKRQNRSEDELTEIRQWTLKIQGTADELMRRQAELESLPRKGPDPTAGEVPRGAPLPPPDDTANREEEEERQRQVRMWIDRLKDRNNDVVFTATVKLADLGDLSAAMPLVDVLTDHKDFYCRLGAATALGSLRAVDAVEALIDALGDKDELVKTAANEALTSITGEDMGFAPDMSRNERSKVQRKWRTWFKTNEGPLRERLNQPLAARNTR